MFKRGFKKISIMFLAITFLFISCLPQTATAASSGDYSLERDVQIAVKVTNTGSETARVIWVQLPLISADSPYQQTVRETFNRNVEKIVVGEAGSRIAHILIDSLAPGQSENIIVDYVLNIRPGGGIGTSSNTDLQQYLKPSGKIESNHPDIVARAKQLIASAQNETDTMSAIGHSLVHI